MTPWLDRNGEAWTGSMLTDRVSRLDIKSGQYTEYMLPRPTNIRRVYVDDSKNPGTLWIGSNHGASIVKVEPPRRTQVGTETESPGPTQFHQEITGRPRYPIRFANLNIRFIRYRFPASLDSYFSGGCMRRALTLCIVAVVLLVWDATGGPDQGQGRKRSRHPAHVGAELLQAAAGPLLRRRHRHRDQLEGTCVRVPPQRRHPAVRVRSERRLRAARWGTGSTASSSRTASASIAQDNIWVVDEGTNMVDQVQPRGTCRDGARPAAGAGGGAVQTSTPGGPLASQKYSSAVRPT